MNGGWWYRASLEQKLAQVDGGIELGLTSNQVAMVSGAKDRYTVKAFGAYHGRHFTTSNYSSLSKARAARFAPIHRRDAYLRGEPSQFWAGGSVDTNHSGEPEEIILE